jgi:predicted O-methyltransferase YrrM
VLERARKLRQEMNFLAQLRFLPPASALFQWRARRLALSLEDNFAQVSATRPRNLAALLGAARGCRRVVELGTGSGWTAISLALADRGRLVVSYDPIERRERERYLRLVGPGTRRRLTFVRASGDEGPRDRGMIDLLYIDSSHDRADTMREVEAWRPALGEGSLVVFDDFAHPDYPGVEDAVRRMGLEGEKRGGLYVHRVGV